MQEINIQRRSPNINIDTATRNYHLPIASATTLGGIKVGTNLTIEDDGTLNAESTEYQLPAATSSTLGGIKVGNGLAIDHQILSVDTDSILDANSTNPVQNSTITNALNTLNSATQANTSNISSINNNLSSLSTTVSDNTNNIATLQNSVLTNTNNISTNTNNIASLSNNVDNLSSSVTSLDDRVDAVESDITDIHDDITGLQVLADESLDTITYSYLLPVSTWTSGNIFVLKRGKVGYIYFDIEGSLTLAAGASQVIYSFANVIPAVKSSSVLLTDDGAIIGQLDDYSYELSLVNLDSQHSKTITKVKGCIPIVFV